MQSREKLVEYGRLMILITWIAAHHLSFCRLGMRSYEEFYVVAFVLYQGKESLCLIDDSGFSTCIQVKTVEKNIGIRLILVSPTNELCQGYLIYTLQW